MRSVRLEPAVARILTAALRAFAEHGYGGAAVRAIASEAQVSPALVLHHYGSKDGLRRACDERLMEYTADKEGILRGGPVPTVGEYLREHPEAYDVLAYLRRVMSDGGPVATELFGRLHAETERMLRVGQQAGTVRQTEDTDAAAAVLTAWSLGALLMHEDLGRALGADSLFSEPAAERYSRTGTEVLTRGLLRLSGSAGPAAPQTDPAAPDTEATAPHTEATTEDG